MSDFDSLSRGDQFLRLLEIEYEDLIKYAKFHLSASYQMLAKYQYSEQDIAAIRENQEFDMNAIQYYEAALRELRGAENEELVLTGEKPESSGQFAGVNCTTVV